MNILDVKGTSDSILTELMSQSDRGCGIIGAAILEDVLTDLLRNRLIGSMAAMERMFSYEKGGPLSTFSAKIEMALAVGVIETSTREDLNAVRSVRNRFAHSLVPLDFSEEKIAAWCSGLKTIYPDRMDEKKPRSRFTVCVATLSLLLWSVANLCPRVERITKATDRELLDALKRAVDQREASQGKSG